MTPTRTLLGALTAAVLLACADPAPHEAPGNTAPPAGGEDAETGALVWRAPGAHRALADEVYRWHDHARQFIVLTQAPPPREALIWTMAALAVHDALNAIEPRYDPYAYTGHANRRASAEAAIGSATYEVLAAVGQQLVIGPPTPNAQPLTYITDAWTAFRDALPECPETDEGIAVGKAAAAAIIAARANDGSIGPTLIPFTSSGTPGAFRPPPPLATSPDGLTGMRGIPYWPAVRTFVLSSGDQFRLPAPYGSHTLEEAVATPAYLSDYEEVKVFGAAGSTARTQDQSDIAAFWTEDAMLTWNRIAATVGRSHRLSAWRAARLLALVNAAGADALIASFDSKYTSNLWRPITAVRLGNLNPATPGLPAWNLANPAVIGAITFPEFASAPAAAGGAAAIVIDQLILGRTAMTIESSTLAGKPRSFPSVNQARHEAIDAQVLAGLHFRTSATVGDHQGRLVGRYVLEHALRPTWRH